MKALFTFSVVALLAALASADSVCTTQTLCSCTTDKGVIDLSPLSSKELTANDLKGAESFTYTPCSSNGTQDCKNAMLCKKTLAGGAETIGTSSGETFVSNDGKIAIEYQGDDNKTSMVILTCDQGEEGALSVVKESSDKDFVFELKSMYACVGGPVTTTKKPTTKTTKKTTKTTKKTTKTTKKTTKTTPKTTKTTPKTTKKTTTPKATTKTTPKSPKTTKTTPKSPKTTKTTPKGPTRTTPRTTKSKTTPKMSTTTRNGARPKYSFETAALVGIFALVRQFL